MLADCVVLDALFVALALLSARVLEGRPAEDGPGLWQAILAAWQVNAFVLPFEWLLFRRCPPRWRVLGLNAIDLVWEAVMSYVIHDAGRTEGAEKGGMRPEREAEAPAPRPAAERGATPVEEEAAPGEAVPEEEAAAKGEASSSTAASTPGPSPWPSPSSVRLSPPLGGPAAGSGPAPRRLPPPAPRLDAREMPCAGAAETEAPPPLRRRHGAVARSAA